MKYRIITLPVCKYCTMAKNLLNKKNIEFEEVVIGKDITRDEVKSAWPQYTTAPIVFNEKGEPIGTYEDLEAKLA